MSAQLHAGQVDLCLASQPKPGAGVGTGLLPAMARHTARPPVSWLHLDAPGCQRTLRMAWRQDTYLSTAARQFRDFAVSHFARQPAAD